MAFSDFEQKAVEKAMDRFLEKRRPPAHIRSQLDIRYRIAGQSVEIVEVRPPGGKERILSRPRPPN